MLTDEFSPFKKDAALTPLLQVHKRKKEKSSLLEKVQKYRHEVSCMESYLIQLSSSNYKYQFELGKLYLTGYPELDLEQSFADAALFLTLAAQNRGSEEGGIVEAQFMLGELYDPSISFPTIVVSSAKGTIATVTATSSTYRYSTPPPMDSKAVVNEISPASITDSILLSGGASKRSASTSDGAPPLILNDTTGPNSILAPIHKNKETSDRWYRMAASNGNPLAAIRLSQYPSIPRLSSTEEAISSLSLSSFEQPLTTVSADDVGVDVETQYMIHMLRFHDYSNPMKHEICISSLRRLHSQGHVESTYKLALHYLSFLSIGAGNDSNGIVSIDQVLALLQQSSSEGHARAAATLCILEVFLEGNPGFVDKKVTLSVEFASKLLQKLEALPVSLVDRRTFHAMGEISRKIYPSSIERFMSHHNNACKLGSPFSNYFIAQVSEVIFRQDLQRMLQVSSDGGYPAAHFEIFESCQVRPGSPEDLAEREEDLIEYKKSLIMSSCYNGQLNSTWQLRLIFADIIQFPETSSWIARERFHNSSVNSIPRRTAVCDSLAVCFIYNCQGHGFIGSSYDIGLLKEKEYLLLYPEADVSQFFPYYLKDCLNGYTLAMYKVARINADPHNRYNIPQDLSFSRNLFAKIEREKGEMTKFTDLLVYLRTLIAPSPTHRMTVWPKARMELMLNVRDRLLPIPYCVGRDHPKAQHISPSQYIEFLYLNSLVNIFLGKIREAFKASDSIFGKNLSFAPKYFKDFKLTMEDFRNDIRIGNNFTTDLLYKSWEFYKDCEPGEVAFIPSEVLRITGTLPNVSELASMKLATQEERRNHVTTPPNGEPRKEIGYECNEWNSSSYNTIPPRFKKIFDRVQLEKTTKASVMVEDSSKTGYKRSPRQNGDYGLKHDGSLRSAADGYEIIDDYSHEDKEVASINEGHYDEHSMSFGKGVSYKSGADKQKAVVVCPCPKPKRHKSTICTQKYAGDLKRSKIEQKTKVPPNLDLFYKAKK